MGSFPSHVPFFFAVYAMSPPRFLCVEEWTENEKPRPVEVGRGLKMERACRRCAAPETTEDAQHRRSQM